MQFTPTVIKNLLRKPATRKYPFEVREPFPKYRGQLVIDIKRCIFCGSCERKCPSQCITVDRDKGTWACDPQACIYCGYCVAACPTNTLSMKNVYHKPTTEPVVWVEQGTPPRHKRKDTPKDTKPSRATDPILDEEAASAEDAASATSDARTTPAEKVEAAVPAEKTEAQPPAEKPEAKTPAKKVEAPVPAAKVEASVPEKKDEPPAGESAPEQSDDRKKGGKKSGKKSGK